VIVVDASALLDALLDGPNTAWVLGWFAQERLCAPAHQPAEVLSATGRLVRAGELTAPTAAALLQDLAELEQDPVLPSSIHLRVALELQDRVRVLDGLYVALAEERRAPLLTTDRRLAGAQLPVQVLAPGSS
jgi:predicted nucleic acid-binding protein